MEALFLKIINLSLTASWLVLAVLLFRLLFRKAPKWIYCLLWGLVGLRLLIPFSPESIFSLVPSAAPLPDEIIYTAHPTINSGITIIDSAVNPILSQSLTPSAGASANPTQIWSAALSVLWVVGVAVMLLYTLISYALLRRRVATATKLRDTIKESEKVDSPFVLGIIRPTIYLPYQMNEADREYVIAHEQAHIRRGDHLYKPLGFLLLSVYWFNPVLWVAYVLLCRDIEGACDEKVIAEMETDQRRAYSTALLNCSVHRRRIAACPLAFGEVGVKERVKGVMFYQKPAFWLVCLAVLACVAVALCFMTNPYGTEIPAEMDAFLSQQILERESPYHQPAFACEDHRILRVEQEGDTTTVYAWVLYLAYEDASLEKASSSHILSVITVREEEGHYVLEEYWIPRDGADYDDDLREKLPLWLYLTETDPTRYVDQQIKRCEEKAKAYFTSVENQPDDGDPGIEIRYEGEPVPTPVLSYATKLVKEQIKAYNGYGVSQEAVTGTTYTITDAKITSLTAVNTGKPGLTLYEMHYYLKPSTDEEKDIFLAGGMILEDGWFKITQPYFVMYHYQEGEERVWAPLGTVTDLDIGTRFSTEEMLETYGDPYTAALMEMLKQYQKEQESPAAPISIEEISSPYLYGEPHYSYSVEEGEYTRYLLIRPYQAIQSLRLTSIPVEVISYTNELYSLEKLDKPLVLGLVFYGDLTTYGLSFTDAEGMEHHYSIYKSGEDGSILWSGEPVLFGKLVREFFSEAWEIAQETAKEKGLTLDWNRSMILHDATGEYVAVEYYEQDSQRHVRVTFLRNEKGEYVTEPTKEETEGTDGQIPPGIIEGTFGYAPDGRPAIYLSEDSGYSDAFMIINTSPFGVPKSSVEGLKMGDRIRITAYTIADLDPRIVDAESIEVISDGEIH